MSIYEYNEEYAKKANFEAGEEAGYMRGRDEGRVEGREEGREEGRDEGQERVNKLNRILGEQKRLDDIIRAASDKAYQEKLFNELGI